MHCPNLCIVHNNMKKMKALSLLLATALTVTSITAVPAVSDAAKKPALSKKKITITVGKTYKIKVKNGNKKAKVTWSTSKKTVAKITRKNTKGKTAYASVKGVKKGSAKITASYKLGKKTTKFTCKVTVKNAVIVTPTAVVASPVATTKAPATQAPATQTPVNSAKPTAVPTKVPPTKTPKPTPAPTASPTAAPTHNPATQPPITKPWPAGADSYSVDLKTAKAHGDGTTIANNADGSITATFGGEYPDIYFVIPEKEYKSGYYKYLEVVYADSDGNRGLSVYDKNIKWDETWNSGDTTKYDLTDSYLPEYSGTCTKIVDLSALKEWDDYLTQVDIYVPTFDSGKHNGGKITVKSIKMYSETVVNSTASPAPTAAPPVDYSTYKVDFSDKKYCDLTQYPAPASCVANADGSVTLKTDKAYGQGHDLVVNIPTEIAAYEYTKVTFKYEVKSGDYRFKYFDKAGTEVFDYIDAKYKFSADKTETSFTFEDAQLPVSKMTMFDFNSAGEITIKSMIFSNPKKAPIATNTPGPTIAPTSVPTSVPTAGPTSVPTSVPTAGPTSVPTSVPTVGPTNTPVPGTWNAEGTLYSLALNADTVKNVEANCNVVANADGTVTATCSAIYNGFNFVLPSSVSDKKFNKIIVNFKNGSGIFAHDLQGSCPDHLNATDLKGEGTESYNLDITKNFGLKYFWRGTNTTETSAAVTITSVYLVPSEPYVAPTATPVPTAVPADTATYDTKTVDLSTLVTATGTGAYSAETGKITINDASGDSVDYLNLPMNIANGETVSITVKGTWTGTYGFRVWIGNGPNSMVAAPQVFNAADLGTGEFTKTFDLTGNNVCNMLTIKNIASWSGGGPIDGLVIDSIDIAYKARPATINPVAIDGNLSKYEVVSSTDDVNIAIDSTTEYGNVAFDARQFTSYINDYNTIWDALKALADKTGGSVTKYLNNGYVTYTATAENAGTLEIKNGDKTYTSDVTFVKSAESIVATITSESKTSIITVTSADKNSAAITKNGVAGYTLKATKDVDSYSVTYTTPSGNTASFTKSGIVYTVIVSNSLVEQYNIVVKYSKAVD